MLFCIKKHMFHSQVFLWVGHLAFQHPVRYVIGTNLQIIATHVILTNKSHYINH